MQNLGSCFEPRFAIRDSPSLLHAYLVLVFAEIISYLRLVFIALIIAKVSLNFSYYIYIRMYCSIYTIKRQINYLMSISIGLLASDKNYFICFLYLIYIYNVRFDISCLYSIYRICVSRIIETSSMTS